MLYANGRPDVVGPWNNPKGEVEWDGDNGYFFGSPSPFASFTDPQCAERVGGADAHNFNLRGNCSLLGLAHVVKEGTPGAIPISNGRFGAYRSVRRSDLANPKHSNYGSMHATY